MRVKVAMLYDDAYRVAGDPIAAVNRDYAVANGYPFVLCRHSLDTNLPIVWSKLRLLQQQMDGCDWLLWLDADAMIVGRQRLDEIVRGDKDVLFSTDVCGYCAGVMFVRCCSWSWRFLDAALLVGPVPVVERNLYDQATLKALIEAFPEVAAHCGGVPESVVQNERSVFNPKALAIHYWGNRDKGGFEPIRRAVDLFRRNGYTPDVARPYQLLK